MYTPTGEILERQVVEETVEKLRLANVSETILQELLDSQEK